MTLGLDCGDNFSKVSNFGKVAPDFAWTSGLVCGICREFYKDDASRELILLGPIPTSELLQMIVISFGRVIDHCPLRIQGVK